MFVLGEGDPHVLTAPFTGGDKWNLLYARRSHQKLYQK